MIKSEVLKKALLAHAFCIAFPKLANHYIILAKEKEDREAIDEINKKLKASIK